MVDKSLHLASLYLTSGDTSFIRSTIIDGMNQNSPIYIRGTSNDNKISNIKLTGLSIINGKNGGTLGNTSYGSGIQIVYADTLKADHLVIRDNNVETNSGGGVHVAQTNYASFESVVIRNNQASSQGAGIWSQGTNLDLSNCIINGNSLTGQDDGGGIYLHEQGTARFINCTIANNQISDGRNGPGFSMNYILEATVFSFIIQFLLIIKKSVVTFPVRCIFHGIEWPSLTHIHQHMMANIITSVNKIITLPSLTHLLVQILKTRI